MDALVDEEARAALVAKIRDEAKALREKPVVVDDSPPTTDDSVRSAVTHRRADPRARRAGASATSTSTSTEVFPYLDRHVLFKLHWGGRGVKGEAWRKIVEGDGEEEGFAPKLERMWARAGLPAAAGPDRLLPVQRRRQRARRLRSRPTTTASSSGSSSRASPSTTGSAWPTSSGRSTTPDERDVVVLQGVTVGPEVTKRIEQLEQDGEFAEQLFVHGLGVQSAEGLAEWLHAQARERARHRRRPGPPLLMGLSRLPGSVRAREGLAPARPRGDRHDASPAATRSSPSSRRWRSSPTTRRPSTSA